jgi:3-dehydroquinate dehydratase-2
MKKFKIINGPNLNFLGKREQIYGDHTLDEIQKYTEEKLKKDDVELHWYQSNIEGEIVEEIQSCVNEDFEAIIINPAAYSHTSVAIYDALKLLKCEIVEVHLTNVYAREDFRQTMLTAKAASKIMSGLGKNAYYLGVMSILTKDEK